MAFLAMAQAPSLQAQALTQDARAKFLQTFTLLQAADVAGATNQELSASVQKLNRALQLLNSADQLEKQGQSKAAGDNVQQAEQLLNATQSDAVALQAQAQSRRQQQNIITYALAPIMAFLTALLYHYGGRAYRRYRVTRTMKMRVRVKPTESKK
jgi:hypothetical protein